jgi:hypothetical protein
MLYGNIPYSKEYFIYYLNMDTFIYSVLFDYISQLIFPVT